MLDRALRQLFDGARKALEHRLEALRRELRDGRRVNERILEELRGIRRQIGGADLDEADELGKRGD